MLALFRFLEISVRDDLLAWTAGVREPEAKAATELEMFAAIESDPGLVAITGLKPKLTEGSKAILK